jgi:hypothetical protein
MALLRSNQHNQNGGREMSQDVLSQDTLDGLRKKITEIDPTIMRGDFEGGIRHLLPIVEAGPNYVRPYHNIGYCFVLASIPARQNHLKANRYNLIRRHYRSLETCLIETRSKNYPAANVAATK